MTKREYEKLQREAVRRMKQLEKHGLSENLQKNYNHGKPFKEYAEIAGNRKEMAKAVHAVRSFTSNKTSTLKGARDYEKKIRGIMKDVKIKGVSVQQFGEFMGMARQANEGTFFDSERAIQAMKTAQENKVDIELVMKNFNAWQEMNIDTSIEKYGAEYDSEELAFILERGTSIIKERKNGNNGNRQGGKRNNGKNEKGIRKNSKSTTAKKQTKKGKR